MNILGITGFQHHGKSLLIELIKQADSTVLSNDTSLLISQVANHLNPSLRQHFSGQLPDDRAAVLTWANSAVIPILRASLHVTFDETALRFSPSDLAEHPERFETLWRYLVTIKENPGLLDAQITPDNKETYRPLLQWIGGFVTASTGVSLWYQEMVAQARAAEHKHLEQLLRKNHIIILLPHFGLVR
jgi:hypothetical protein